MSMTLEELEGIGPKFSLDDLMAMRNRTRWAVHAIADGIQPGMAEEEAKDHARKLLESLGMRRGWHHIITRCGSNTTKDFMARSEPGVVLQPDDIFFVDIGPIHGDSEGDAGDTFVLGGDADHLRAKADVRDIWDAVREDWFSSGSTGRELYAFANKTAADLGWKLNFDLSGHRLSDFPHSAHYDGSIADVDFALRPERWVLEIAIAHPEREFGAFYEDLLLEDQSFPDWVFDPSHPPA
ncbi:MAG TPA: M24 family metallopeptidase [Acidimicrobiales bacterium]|jgi:Xaa-Pro aminopeptidase|nr:M24 family metallopeptidase [Acidimicrobiales bacterium]